MNLLCNIDISLKYLRDFGITSLKYLVTYVSTATTVVGAYWITVRRNVSRGCPKLHRITKSPRNSIDKLLVASESNCKVKRLRIDEYMPGEVGPTSGDPPEVGPKMDCEPMLYGGVC